MQENGLQVGQSTKDILESIGTSSEQTIKDVRELERVVGKNTMYDKAFVAAGISVVETRIAIIIVLQILATYNRLRLRYCALFLTVQNVMNS